MVNTMSDIKLVALDLDGTLLDSEKRLSKRNEGALRACIEQGVAVVPTTGRTVDGIPDFVRNLPGVRYAITTNGAMIEDLTEGEVIETNKMSNNQAVKYLRMINSYHVMYDPYINGRGLTEERFFLHLEEYGLSPRIQELVHKTRDVVPNIIEAVIEGKQEVEKINLFFPNLEERAKVRELLIACDDIELSSSMPNNLEINALGATKGKGILRLASHLGLEQNQTLACGDGENDITMIQLAGVGVAMGNAEEYLKEMADYITLTNDEDGVAAAIEKFVLKL